jgi:hypothetical protein
MAKPTYLEEIIPFVTMGTVIITLLGAIGYGIVSSFIIIEIPANSELLGFSFALSLILANILYFRGIYLLKDDKIEELTKKIVTLEKRNEFEISRLKKKIEELENS